MTGLRTHSALNSEFSASAIALSYQVALGPDGGDGLGEPLGVTKGSVLHSAVGVLCQTSDVPAALLGHKTMTMTIVYANPQELHQMGEPNVSVSRFAA